jgi:hypothetical protein
MFGGCGNGTSDPVCECPEGTTHAEGETCCEGTNCNCKEVKYYNTTFDGKTISVEDRSGEKVTQKELDIIQNNLTKRQAAASRLRGMAGGR